MTVCVKCGFDEFTDNFCEKCGLSKNGNTSNLPKWGERLEPQDSRFWLVLQTRSGVTRLWLPIILERLRENDIFGLGPEIQFRERWAYFCDDEEYESELDLIYAELKVRFEEFEQILKNAPDDFQHVVQAIYWPKMVGQGSVQKLILDRFIFRNKRITESGFDAFWERQFELYKTSGFNRYFLDMENSLREIASMSPQPLTDEELKLIEHFHGSSMAGDVFRARSWKNRWSK